MGPSSRKYLLERPSHAEVEETLWRMVFDAKCEKEELKEKLKKKDEDLKKQEQNLKDWEHHLDVRERQIDNEDESLSKLIKDLRVKDSVIDIKNDELRRMKREMDECIYHAREDRDREWQVGVFVLVNMCL